MIVAVNHAFSTRILGSENLWEVSEIFGLFSTLFRSFLRWKFGRRIAIMVKDRVEKIKIKIANRVNTMSQVHRLNVVVLGPERSYDSLYPCGADSHSGRIGC